MGVGRGWCNQVRDLAVGAKGLPQSGRAAMAVRIGRPGRVPVSNVASDDVVR